MLRILGMCERANESERERESQHRVVFHREQGNETQPQLSRKQVAQLLMLHIFRNWEIFFRLQVGATPTLGHLPALRVVPLRLNLNEHQTVRHKPVDAAPSPSPNPSPSKKVAKKCWLFLQRVVLL